MDEKRVSKSENLKMRRGREKSVSFIPSFFLLLTHSFFFSLSHPLLFSHPFGFIDRLNGDNTCQVRMDGKREGEKGRKKMVIAPR